MTQTTSNIRGYRQLTQLEQDEMNALKTIEQEVANALILLEQKYGQSRHLSIARTHLEAGFMFALKAIARPTGGLGG